MAYNEQNKGFVQLIIILALLVIILSLLGVSLSSLFSHPVLKDNFGFLGGWLQKLWNNYLSTPFNYVFHFFIQLIWQPFLNTVLNGLQTSSPK